MAHPCSIRGDVARARLLTVGLSQVALAEQLGVPLRTVQRWFAGGRLSLEDADAVAAALGVGTAELFEGVPSDAASPFVFLRTLGALLGGRATPLVRATTSVLESFEFIDQYITFSAHPRRGYVRRLETRPGTLGFRRFVVQPGVARELAFSASISRSLGYEFGRVSLAEDGGLHLSEHFHTRNMRGVPRPNGSFDVDIWVPREMRELVLVADADVDVQPAREPRGTEFDLGCPSTAHALCFRPAPGHLRQAGLPGHDDRIRGDRRSRVDGFLWPNGDTAS